MDVMLDSNSYIADLRMESIGFKNLFDYLRRTKCALILPRLIREETVTKYRYLLEVQAKKTAQAVESLNKLIVQRNSEVHFAPLKSVHAARHLRQKFKDLQKAGLVRYYPDVSGVDINQVFLRGVKRRRPASKEGEELRDVIIWLIALQYAEKEKRQIAVVTNDSGFWDETDVHEHLKKDIQERKLDVSLFRNIDDFIKSSAPEPKPVDEAYATKAFDVRTLADEITATTKKALSSWKRFYQPFTIKSLKLETVRFSSGAVYGIDANTQFAELSYEVFLVADLAFVEVSFGSVKPSFGSFLGALSAARGPLSTPSSPLIGYDLGFRMYRPALGLGASAFDPSPQHAVMKAYAVSANVQIFLRLLNGKPSEIELNRLEITKADDLALAVFSWRIADTGSPVAWIVN